LTKIILGTRHDFAKIDNVVMSPGRNRFGIVDSHRLQPRRRVAQRNFAAPRLTFAQTSVTGFHVIPGPFPMCERSAIYAVASNEVSNLSCVGAFFTSPMRFQNGAGAFCSCMVLVSRTACRSGRSIMMRTFIRPNDPGNGRTLSNRSCCFSVL